MIDGYQDFVFSTKNNNPIMPSSVNNLLLNIVNRYNSLRGTGIELPHISAHNLRHTMAGANVDPKVLPYLMEYSRISVRIEVYSHIASDRNKKAMKNMRLIG